MNIAGFQKLSLIDFPGVIASVIFTQGCAFRCSYCHNPDLIPFKPTSPVDPATVLAYLHDQRHFLEGVCITGGEPTLQRDLAEFIRQVRQLGYTIKLDTSGINPDMVKQLLAGHLVDYIAMDIKNAWSRYAQIVNVNNQQAIDNCRTVLSMIQASGVPHEFRTTMHPDVHTLEDFTEMAGYLANGETYVIQKTRFTKLLDPTLQANDRLGAETILGTLQQLFPTLHLSVR